jgi:hypothetical protein
MEHVYHLEILIPEDQPRILAFASARLALHVADENERTFAAWKAAWRPEALEHYLGLGWSFGVFRREKGDEMDGRRMAMAGFALVQPILFYRGQTQSLWAEYFDGETDDAVGLLVDYTIKMARDKHMQRVLVQNGKEIQKFVSLQSYAASATLLADSTLEIRTTKG